MKHHYFLLAGILILTLLVLFIIKNTCLVKKDMVLTDFDPDHFNSCKMNVDENSITREYILQSPPDYNANRQYPLVIALHGWTRSEETFFSPVILDNKEQALQYPCFYLAPNNSTRGWDDNADWVRELTNDIIKSFSIDNNRIYIIGFSMGGSGSFSFAESLYRDWDIITAGIIRCAGKSQTELIFSLRELTAVWYHVGTKDSDLIMEVADAFFKSYSETFPAKNMVTDSDVASGFHRETKAFALNGKEIVRYSRYEEMGHEYVPVFEDEKVLNWLFNQSLKKSVNIDTEKKVQKSS